jgi:CBS domain-containing protein
MLHSVHFFTDRAAFSWTSDVETISREIRDGTDRFMTRNRKQRDICQNTSSLCASGNQRPVRKPKSTPCQKLADMSHHSQFEDDSSLRRRSISNQIRLERALSSVPQVSHRRLGIITDLTFRASVGPSIRMGCDCSVPHHIDPSIRKRSDVRVGVGRTADRFFLNRGTEISIIQKTF